MSALTEDPEVRDSELPAPQSQLHGRGSGWELGEEEDTTSAA